MNVYGRPMQLFKVTVVSDNWKNKIIDPLTVYKIARVSAKMA